MQAVWCTRCSVAPGPGFHRFEVSPIFSNDLVLLKCCFSHFLLFCIFQGEAACIFSRRGTFSISNSIALRYDTIWYNAPKKIWDWWKFDDSIDIQLVHCPWSLKLCVLSSINVDSSQPLNVSGVVPSGDGLWGVSLLHPGPLPRGWPDMYFHVMTCSSHTHAKIMQSSSLDEQVSLHLFELADVQSIVHFESSRRESFGRWSATWDAKSIWQGCQHAPVLKTSQDHVGLIIHIKWINFDQTFWPRSESFIRHYLSQILEVARSWGWDSKNKKLDVVQHCIQMHPKQKWIRNTCYTLSTWCNGCNLLCNTQIQYLRDAQIVHRDLKQASQRLYISLPSIFEEWKRTQIRIWLQSSLQGLEALEFWRWEVPTVWKMFGTCISRPEGRERADWAARCAKLLVFLARKLCKSFADLEFWMSCFSIEVDWNEGNCKLIDFGSAKDLANPQALSCFQKVSLVCYLTFVRSKELGPTTSRAWCRTCDVEKRQCHEEICDWSRLEPCLHQCWSKAWRTQLEHPISWLQRLLDGFLDPVSIYLSISSFGVGCCWQLVPCTIHERTCTTCLLNLYSFTVSKRWSFTSALILTGCEKQRLWLSVGHMVLGLLSDLALAHFKHYNDLSHPMSYLHMTIHHWDLSSPHRASALLWRAWTSSCQDDCRGLCGEDGFLSQMGSYRTVCRIYKKICGLDCKKYISTCWHLFEVEWWSNYVESRS